MIRQWFATMNELLDDLITRYPHASGEEMARLLEQWNMLKSVSDDIIESWLQFEDKMASFRDLQHQGVVMMDEPQKFLDPFVKGQGYFKLQMFGKAAEKLTEAIAECPDFTAARLYLAMSLMHLKEWDDAQRHFQLIAGVTDEPKLKAIAYNALGCIQAVYANLDKAQNYFRQALQADPSFKDPKRNLESCRPGAGQMQLQFGSAELQTMVHV